MNDSEYKHFRELNWRGKMSPAQEAQLQAWLASHPQARAEWELESALSKAMGGLPDAPMPSNFVNRVRQAVDREQAAASRRVRQRQWAWWRRFLPRLGLGSLAAAAGVVSSQQLHRAHVRAELRQSVVAVATVPSLPGPEALQNFDAIYMSAESAADEQLLKLLQ